MHEATEWTTEFYRDRKDNSPVEEFLDTVHDKTRTRFRWSMVPEDESANPGQ